MEAIMKEDSMRVHNGNNSSTSENSGSLSDTSSVNDTSRMIADDVKFSEAPVPTETTKEKKRRRQDADAETKRLQEEEYNRQLHEQRYKRLMHLLNRSKFYASYIVKKIDTESEKDAHKIKRKPKGKGKLIDENTPPMDNGNKKAKISQKYDIREYISTDVEKKLHLNKKRLNLSQEEIEDELGVDSETETKESSTVDVVTPKYFNGNLYEYQKEGLQWLKVLYENGINGILADEMGLGKTIQVIALICHLIEKCQDGPYLIIAPLSTIPNWMIEFEKFAPNVPVIVFHGPQNERLHLQRKIKQKHYITESYRTQPVVLTTFEIPLTENNFLKTQNWRYIIIDEGHRIKNHECQLVQVLKTFKSMNRLLLTGTPLQNNLAELWSLLHFLLPEIFDDLAIFESWFDAKELQYDEGTEKFLKQEEEKHVLSSLREILKPFMLRREKSDVNISIPPKKEVIVYAPITELQHDLYKAVLDRDISTLSKMNESPIIQTEDGRRPKRKCVLRSSYNNRNNSGISEQDMSRFNPESDDSADSDVWKRMKSTDKKNLLMWKQYTDVTERNRDFLIHITFRSRIIMYKKIVNHPYLVHCPLDSVGLPKIDDDLIKASGKLLVLDAMLARLKSQGHKVLIFSTMTMILDMLEDYLTLRDYRYARLDGNIKLEHRKESIKNFNTDPELFLFLISTRAGGVGLNLASADTVIIYDSDWNPQADIQAMARCHRIGQTRPVVIYRLCTKGTIDEAIIKRAEAKRILEKIVISKEVRSINMNSKETLMELKRLLESKECEVVTSEKEVFTEAELSKLLDRSDLIANGSKVF